MKTTIERIFYFQKIVLIFYMLLSLICYDLNGLQLAFSAEADFIAANRGGGQSDKLLNLYFRRIDSFYGTGKLREAKNELNKVYMIDPSNSRAKEYEQKIEAAQMQDLAQKEKQLAKQEMLIGAHKVLREKQEVSQAFQRILERRAGNRDRIIGSYFETSDENQVEFDRLQKLGLERYKAAVIQEAKEFERQDRFKMAVSKYKDILAIDPNDIKARKLLQTAKMEVETQMDSFILGFEDIDDEYLIRQVTQKALAAADYENAMAGGGYAQSLQEPKPPLVSPLEKKMKIPVTADFRNVSLVSVLNFLADYTGINIITSQLVIEEERKVSVRFKNLPLKSALKYILKGQGLSHRIEEDIIWVATIDEMENEELETRVYYLEKGSGIMTQFSSSTFGVLGTRGRGSSVSGTSTIADLIEGAVPFPPGAKIIFDPRLAALIVTNTPTNLQKIEHILYILDEPPQQILIESRFIEVIVDDDINFGIDMDIDDTVIINDRFGFPDKTYGFLEASGYDFTGVSAASVPSGVNLSFAGLLTHPQFQIFLNALEKNTKTKTLSAPKITTVNNQTAIIKVVTEEVFPTSFEVSLIQQDLNGDGDLDDAGETIFANVPQEFVSRDIGIVLEVTPSVGMDHKTITLAIIPEVSTVAATPAKFVTTDFDGSTEITRGTGTPNLPRFTTSTLSTTVILESGETAVLGGLITETRGQTHEKVPFLGDLPWIGRLFRSDQDDITRRNLIIFITGTVLN